MLWWSECSIDMDLSILKVGAAECCRLKFRILKAELGKLSRFNLLLLDLRLKSKSGSTNAFKER